MIKQELRILDIFEKLNEGQVLSKEKLSNLYGVEEKTIRRDIENIRQYYKQNYKISNAVIYSRLRGGYISTKRLRLSNSEIFALIKMLLENRTFDKAETQEICDNLLNLGTLEDQGLIKQLVGAESLQYESYVKFRKRQPLLIRLWELANYIANKEELIIKNERQDGEMVTHTVYPLEITFSEYYFYLIVYYKDDIGKGARIFRIDRIRMVEPTGRKVDDKHLKEYKTEQFKDKLQFMYGGKDIHLQFKFWGASIDAVMDRIPNAEKEDLKDGSYMVRAHVFDSGIKMWLLSQMEYLEVIKPPHFRDEIAQTIQRMSEIYNN